jgi:hypothetical protein
VSVAPVSSAGVALPARTRSAIRRLVAAIVPRASRRRLGSWQPAALRAGTTRLTVALDPRPGPAVERTSSSLCAGRPATDTGAEPRTAATVIPTSESAPGQVIAAQRQERPVRACKRRGEVFGLKPVRGGIYGGWRVGRFNPRGEEHERFETPAHGSKDAPWGRQRRVGSPGGGRVMDRTHRAGRLFDAPTPGASCAHA